MCIVRPTLAYLRSSPAFAVSLGAVLVLYRTSIPQVGFVVSLVSICNARVLATHEYV